MATSDQPYKVGDHVTFTTLGRDTEPRQGTILSVAAQVPLDGSQTAYVVLLDDLEGNVVGIAHTDVLAVTPTKQQTSTEQSTEEQPAETPAE